MSSVVEYRAPICSSQPTISASSCWASGVACGNAIEFQINHHHHLDASSITLLSLLFSLMDDLIDVIDEELEDLGVDETISRYEAQHLNALKRIVYTYSKVWQRFYQWEPHHCDQALHSLAVMEPVDPVFDVSRISADGEEDQEMDSGSDTATDVSESQPLTFTSWNFERGAINSWECDNGALNSISPHPRYYACTPSLCNVVSSETATDRVELKFMMFGDDPTFDDRHHSQTFGSFSWQRTWHDPDFNVICFSTLKRLLIPPESDDLAPDDDPYFNEPPLSRDLINSKHVFPRSVHDIIFEMKQRRLHA